MHVLFYNPRHHTRTHGHAHPHERFTLYSTDLGEMDNVEIYLTIS